MDENKKLTDLIPALETKDCNVEIVEGGIRISYFEGGVFDVFEMGGWVQVGTALIQDDEIEDMVFKDEVFEFLLQLNSRCLGCRFSLDPDGTVLIVEDVPIEKISAEVINEHIDSLAFVAYVFYDLILEVGGHGIAPSDDEVDLAINDKETAYDKYH